MGFRADQTVDRRGRDEITHNNNNNNNNNDDLLDKDDGTKNCIYKD